MSRRKQQQKTNKRDSKELSVKDNRTYDNSSKPEGRKFDWPRMKHKLAAWACFAFVTSPVLGPIVIGCVYVPLCRASLTSVEFTVDRRERVVKVGGDSIQSFFLVWSKEGEVFCVTDTWSFMSFDASDRYGQLHEGNLVQGKAAGWRVPFLSWYRNVVVVDSAKSP